MASRKTLAIIGITVAAAVCIILAVLWQTGFLVTDKSVIPGKGFVPLNKQTLQDYEKQNLTVNGLPSLFLFLMNQTAKIPGIDKVSLQVYTSNDTLSSVENQYNLLMQERGYSPQPKYSGTYSNWSQSITYQTYNHGISGIVVFMSSFLEKHGSATSAATSSTYYRSTRTSAPMALFSNHGPAQPSSARGETRSHNSL